MLGVGGVLAEALADVAFRLAPLDDRDAEDLIDDLRSQAVLGAVRGEPAVDRAALARLLRGLSDLVGDDPTIRSVDLNPLIVHEGVPIAVDALVELDA
jgi:acetyl-CoA synthetase (ADP-forming)